MWAQLISAVAAGANSGKPSYGTGGASGYGLANTASVRAASDGTAYGASPFDSSNWTVATGSARASASNGAIPTEYLVIGGLLLAVFLWKKH